MADQLQESETYSRNSHDGEFLRKTLIENWRRETEAAQLYTEAASAERDPARQNILSKLAKIEFQHAAMWAGKLQLLGFEVEKLLAGAPASSLRSSDSINDVKSIGVANNVDLADSLDPEGGSATPAGTVASNPVVSGGVEASDGVLHAAASAPRVAPATSGVAASASMSLIDRIESIESGNAAWYESLRNVLTDPELLEVINRIDEDERQHGDVQALLGTVPVSHKHVKKHLISIWGAERWHRQSSNGWVGDAIYGVNDGLGAIFGIIAGVAGFTASNSHTVLISGFFGALASTLSMGAGAYLAAESENELMESEMEHERQEIVANPEHELEELALLYQLKGFTAGEATSIAQRIGSDPHQLLQTMAQEELGIHEATKGNPWQSAIFGSLSTLVGGLIPLIPFFFMTGMTAMVVAAVVSILAHFVVGALKSTMTVRSWWSSGLEMTGVGVIVGVVSYGLGVLGANLLG